MEPLARTTEPLVERRICAGDWVRVAGTGASLRGLGKVVEGFYSSEDASLRAARIEFARGTFWYAAGEVCRVRPDEEVRLCAEALQRVQVTASAADRLRAAIERAGERRFVRSPGLLDLLWSLAGTLPNERAVSGIVRFFEEGGSERAATPSAPPPAAPFHVEPRLRRGPTLRAKRDTVFQRVLATLNHAVLLKVAAVEEIPHLPGEPAESLRSKILASRAGLATVLELLSDNQLKHVGRVLGLGDHGELGLLVTQIVLLHAAERPGT